MTPQLDCAAVEPVAFTDLARAPARADAVSAKLLADTWTKPKGDEAPWKAWANLLMRQSQCETTALPGALAP